MAQEARTYGRTFIARYVVAPLLGIAVFVGLPEAARWANNGAFAQSAGAEPPHDNTFYGNVSPSLSRLAQGHDNTVVGPTDSNGDTIILPGTASGSHACTDSTGVAIGSHAGAGTCNPK